MNTPSIASVGRVLGSAVKSAARRPERAMFFGASAALIAAGMARSRKVESVAKPMVMGSIQAGLLRTAGERDKLDNALLLGASTAALVGDYFMMREEFSEGEESDREIVRGAGFFAVNHLLLSALALRHGGRYRVEELLPRAGSAGGAAALLAATNLPLMVPLGAYSTALGTTAALLADPGLVPDDAAPNDPRRALVAGGLLFTISDATILQRRTFFKDTPTAPWLEAVVLKTYVLAQLLIYDGLQKVAARPAAG